MAGHADLAYDDDVEFDVERSSNLGGHRDATARERQHDGVGPPALVTFIAQQVGEGLPGVNPITEQSWQTFHRTARQPVGQSLRLPLRNPSRSSVTYR